jgi:hypothetical protein
MAGCHRRICWNWPIATCAEPNPVSAEEIAAAEQEIERERRALQKSVDELRLELAAIKREMLLRRLAAKAYNPNQPRVPKGNDGAGEWTSDGATGSRIRFASSEKPRLGPSAIVQIATETAKRLLDAYRSENGLRDLFGRNRGTVAVTTIDGINVYGSNSNSPTYTVEDRSAAESMRNALSERYPELMYSDHPGGMPKNALFHAETTILLRSARQNFGTLAGRSLDIYVDRGMCNNCEQLLPYVGLELGDPEVTFIGPTGIRRTMRGGSWVERRK